MAGEQTGTGFVSLDFTTVLIYMSHLKLTALIVKFCNLDSIILESRKQCISLQKYAWMLHAEMKLLTAFTKMKKYERKSHKSQCKLTC